MECKDTLQLFSLSYSCDTCCVWRGGGGGVFGGYHGKNRKQMSENGMAVLAGIPFSSYFKHRANRAHGNNVQAKVPSNHIKISEPVMP